MCGICGFTKAAQTEGDFATLEKMCEVMAHRGPDGEGRRIADGVDVDVQSSLQSLNIFFFSC